MNTCRTHTVKQHENMYIQWGSNLGLTKNGNVNMVEKSIVNLKQK